MRYRLLGPLELWRDGRPLSVGGPQQRGLLAVLLLNANRVVSMDRLAAHLWGDDPPPTARGLLRGCVAGLRRVLLADGGGRQPLLTRAPGYLLEVRPGELDLDRFEELVRDAARLSARSDRAELEQAGALLAEALSLWRGPALEDLALQGYEPEAARLDECRMTAIEQRVDIDLRLGRNARVIAELQVQVREHPLRELMWAQLMVALNGAGRRADALAEFRRLRRDLVEKLGVEPGNPLQRLHQAILSDGDAFEAYRQTRDGVGERTPPPLETAAPAQLPAEAFAFTGRDRQLTELDDLLAGSDSNIGVIWGAAGVGKTALAVRWAHRVRERFADGQFYVDLRGYAPTPPVRPIDALAGMLQALGVAADRVPVEVGQAAALYRSLLADRQVLVVLDNARTAEQVRPLLPGGRGCTVLVTSRDRLAGLVARDGARPLSLDVLTADEAVALLTRLLGADRAGAEPQAVAELARLCALLPLALRIAAANITCQSHVSIAGQVASMTVDRLGALRIDNDEQCAVSAAIELSYHTLDFPTRRLLRLLGLVPGPDVDADAASALGVTAPADAARLLDRLTDLHLLARTETGRYALHDLVRLYAIERVNEEHDDADRAAAIQRLLDWYLHATDRAARLLGPEKLRLPVPPVPQGLPPVPFDEHATALSWLDTERANLRAAVQHAAAHGPRPAAWLLADALRGYFWHRLHLVDWLAVAQAAMTAAQAEGDLRAEAATELSLADAALRRSRYRPATEHYTRALALAQRCGWLEAEATALGNLGVGYRQAGRLTEAADRFERALMLNQRTGWIAGQAGNLTFLGRVQLELGRLRQVADHHEQALKLFREIGSRYGEALSLTFLGETFHALGLFDRAVEEVSAALALCREIGNLGSEADALRILAAVHRDAGRPDLALEHANAAVGLARDTSDRRVEADALNTLATIHRREARPSQAMSHHERALNLARENTNDYCAVQALTGLALAHSQMTQAETFATEAIALARRCGYLDLEGHARTALATACLAHNRHEQTIRYAKRALAIHQETGHRLGEASAHLLAGQALQRRGSGTAETHLRQALALFAAIGAPVV